MREADINLRNSLGLSPLHIAIENNLPDKIINFLIENGANY